MSAHLKRKDLRKAIKDLEKQLARLQLGVDKLIAKQKPAKPGKAPKPVEPAKAVAPQAITPQAVKKLSAKKTPAKKATAKKAPAKKTVPVLKQAESSQAQGEDPAS